MEVVVHRRAGRPARVYSDTQLSAVPQGVVIILLGEESHTDLDGCVEWPLHEPCLVDVVSLPSRLFSRTEWDPEQHWQSDAALNAVAIGVCVRTWVWWSNDSTSEGKEGPREGQSAQSLAPFQAQIGCSCWGWS